MRRLLILGLCLSVVALASTSAQASALGLLFNDGSTVNLMEDNDFEFLIDNDDDGFVTAGDYLVGMIWIQHVADANDPTKINIAVDDTFSSHFVLEVDSVGDVNSEGLRPFVFKPADKDVWDTLEDRTGQNLGLTDPVVQGTIFKAYDDSSDPFQNQEAGDSIADALATALDGTPLWEFGFTTTDGTNFWTALTNASGNDIDKLIILQVYASLNQTHSYAAGDSVKFLPHNYLFDGTTGISNPLGLNVYSDLQGFGGLSSEDEGHFDIATDTDFYIVPTPEPGSIALLGLGLLAGGIFIRRRRS